MSCTHGSVQYIQGIQRLRPYGYNDPANQPTRKKKKTQHFLAINQTNSTPKIQRNPTISEKTGKNQHFPTLKIVVSRFPTKSNIIEQNIKRFICNFSGPMSPWTEKNAIYL